MQAQGRQQTTLTKDSGAFEFSVPVEASYMKAINDTGAKVDFTFDFKTTEASLPTPMLYYNNVESKKKVALPPRYDLKLRAYVTSDYTEGQILQGEITVPVLWEVDLAELSETTTWNLTWDASAGHYKITKA
ncbi:hypothetical protein DFJ58DRAFT_826192 [Suillus subalutaceus]|uniref:uncharacterized protein n=1 Tax=Suillus subalutaceus TaxID=48586 RepID=UPI001B878237|nr:uncharacterized protein DFJ58DRAFT_826192 [Suillus subalutaceus]KAG1829021.1 hypothetical protein DFJ58DRAFT_826192 [Suillus subalutaceus]